MSSYFLEIFHKEEERKKSPAKVEVNFVQALKTGNEKIFWHLTNYKTKNLTDISQPGQ